ncbi:MAG: 3-deoxy-manno-octulosonate cytidylyltransferase [Deltaproteobacteria bacterium]|nr:3-deoxy-manno-octulosonate cytidylyltransferase [Deltaproteobacteria bacterium]MCL4873356.1 3-deoxy-manno-octulosonate cytidylyltransferase [bacterium]
MTKPGTEQGGKGAIGIIPARMASTRFPGKPLRPILGMPMIGHVYLRSRLSPALDEVYVATCDAAIRDYVQSIGGKAIMTLDTHERASDRTAEAMLKVEDMTGRRAEIVVMIQGDEPMVTPEMIERAVEPILDGPEVNIVNLMAEISQSEAGDPNEIKVVVDKRGDAVYFSREAIPSGSKYKGGLKRFKQVCVIPFRRESLLKFNSLGQTPLEIIESVDMLRLIENGLKVRMVAAKAATWSVDTVEDLKKVEQAMMGDPMLARYMGKAAGARA